MGASCLTPLQQEINRMEMEAHPLRCCRLCEQEAGTPVSRKLAPQPALICLPDCDKV